MVMTYIFRLEFLFAAPDTLALEFLVDLVEVLLVLEPQLLVDDVEVADRVHLALHVSDLLVLEGS